MLSTLVHTVLVVALATRHVAANIQISTPTLTQCQDATISYSGGQGSYGLYVVPSEDPCADSVVNIPEQSGLSYKWKVNIPAGSKVELLAEDSTGAEAWSGIITVQSSSDSSCVDPKAAQALNSANSASNSTSSAASKSPSSGGASAPSTTVQSPTITGSSYASGVANSVGVAGPSGVADAAGNHNHSNSGFPHVALPPVSLLGVVTLLFTVAHL